MKKIWQNSNVWTAVLCVLALILIVAPLMYIARYIWPCSDDFGLSLWTLEAWQETGNIFRVLKRAWDYVVFNYLEWQGAYSSIFLMALQPDIWGSGFYRMGIFLSGLFQKAFQTLFFPILRFIPIKIFFWGIADINRNSAVIPVDGFYKFFSVSKHFDGFFDVCFSFFRFLPDSCADRNSQGIN